ncbi:hypothetical protein Taro_030301 [Colocasia esculenta]|uniref:Uncharacterized protein n=1 Tax=Colocasia esculenta TaxID=4460 RepID=A0A843VG03_COLES|nr:hypothetical protein [Colocasia esculenta]
MYELSRYSYLNSLLISPDFRVFESVGGGATFGAPGGGPGGRVITMLASFPAGSECELQESVAAVAGCACCERGCYFARAAVGFVLGLCIHLDVSQRLREPTCGVAFTSAGLWSTEPVEGVLALLDVPLLLGCVLVGCPLVVGVCAVLVVFGLVCLCTVGRCALLSRHLCSKQMLVCHIALLVERCDSYLWLLPALCWLVVNSGEVLPEFFSVGSGGGEVFPRSVLCSFLVVATLPSGLRCIAWLLCSGGVSQNCLLFS